MSKTKIKKIAAIGRSKKSLFDILLENNVLRGETKTTTTAKDNCINVFDLIRVLHQDTHRENEPKWNVKHNRLKSFLERAKEKPQKNNIQYRYSPAQQLQLASYLKELSNNCKNAAKRIEEAAKKDPHQNITFFEIETVNQFHKKKETAKTKEMQKSIFGNIIK